MTKHGISMGNDYKTTMMIGTCDDVGDGDSTRVTCLSGVVAPSVVIIVSNAVPRCHLGVCTKVHVGAKIVTRRRTGIPREYNAAGGIETLYRKV